MRPPLGAMARYVKALDRFVALLHARTMRELAPVVLGDLAPGVRVRADAMTPAQQNAVAHMLTNWRLSANENSPGSLLAQQIAVDVAGHNAREFGRVFRVPVPTPAAGLGKAIDDFRDENVSLISSIETQYLERVGKAIKDFWDEQVRAGEQRGALSDLDETNATAAESLSERLQAEFSVTKARADLIARDQTLKLNAQLTRTRQQVAGVKRYVWTTSSDERVRGNPNGKYPDSASNHFVLDGRVFSWDDPPVVNEKTGDRAHPGEDYQCRCVAVPVLDDPTEGLTDAEIEAIFSE